MQKRVALELVETETTFVKSCDKIVKEFYEPLKRLITAGGVPSLSDGDLSTIFSNICLISALNHKFLEQLKATDTADLGSFFLEFVHFFKMYGQYARNHSVAVERLNNVRQRSSKNEGLFASLEKGSKATLESLLIMPIQRIPRYEMLLREITKHTDPSSADYNNLTKALSLVHEVATHMNEMIRSYENSTKIRYIEKRFVTSPRFLAPGREFIREGHLKKRGRKSKQDYKFFLFNDLVAYASLSRRGSMTGSKYKLHRSIEINKAFSCEKYKSSDSDSFGFTITSAAKSFVVFAVDADEQDSWVTDIQNCMAEFEKRQKHKKEEETKDTAPVWKPDQSVGKCPYCAIRFTLLNRRHHCRKCGNIACGACSSQKAVLPTHTAPQRVCNSCFDKLDQDTDTDKENASKENVAGQANIPGPPMHTPPKANRYSGFTLPRKFKFSPGSYATVNFGRKSRKKPMSSPSPAAPVTSPGGIHLSLNDTPVKQSTESDTHSSTPSFVSPRNTSGAPGRPAAPPAPNDLIKFIPKTPRSVTVTPPPPPPPAYPHHRAPSSPDVTMMGLPEFNEVSYSQTLGRRPLTPKANATINALVSPPVGLLDPGHSFSKTTFTKKKRAYYTLPKRMNFRKQPSEATRSPTLEKTMSRSPIFSGTEEQLKADFDLTSNKKTKKNEEGGIGSKISMLCIQKLKSPSGPSRPAPPPPTAPKQGTPPAQEPGVAKLEVATLKVPKPVNETNKGWSFGSTQDSAGHPSLSESRGARLSISNLVGRIHRKSFNEVEAEICYV